MNKENKHDLFPEVVLFPAMERAKHIALALGRTARRMVGFVPEDAPDAMSDHYEAHEAPTNVIRFPHGSEGDYYEDGA